MKSWRLLVNMGRVHDSEDSYTDDYMKKIRTCFSEVGAVSNYFFNDHNGMFVALRGYFISPTFINIIDYICQAFSSLWQKLPFFKKTDIFSNPAYDVLVSVQHHQIKMFHFSPVTMNFLNKNKLVPLWNLFLAFITTTCYFFISPFYFM